MIKLNIKYLMPTSSKASEKIEHCTCWNEFWPQSRITTTKNGRNRHAMRILNVNKTIIVSQSSAHDYELLAVIIKMKKIS